MEEAEAQKGKGGAVKKQKNTKVAVLPWMRSPVDITNIHSCPLNNVPFLDSRLEQALKKMGFSLLFPVQVAVWQETIGPGCFERDLCINSPTGSGKTLAYALPILQSLSNRSIKCLRALIVLPTRDLALQVKEVFAALASAVGLSVGLAVGQSSISDEIEQLVKKSNIEHGICYDPEDFSNNLQSSVDILVATPGRLMDHINSTKGFTLEHLCYLVVDETDRLLREAYQSWLPTVLNSVQCTDENISVSPPSGPSFGSLMTFRRCGVERGFKGKCYPRLTKMVLSATLTQDPSKLAQLNLHHPLLLTTGQNRYQLSEQLKSYKVICESKLKPMYLIALLRILHSEKCIVFTNSVESAHRLCKLLKHFGDLGFVIKEYSGLQRQSIKSKIIKAFRAGKINVLVSSDAMSRGMDVEGVGNVINYDMPPYTKTYVHRAGRTARAGQFGSCFTLLRKHEVKQFKKILLKAGKDSCPIYPIPSESVESFRSGYHSALEKLKKSVHSEKHKKRQILSTNALAAP